MGLSEYTIRLWGRVEVYSVLYTTVCRVPVWSGVWGRDESVFGDLSISLSHVLVDFKRLLYSTPHSNLSY